MELEWAILKTNIYSVEHFNDFFLSQLVSGTREKNHKLFSEGQGMQHTLVSASLFKEEVFLPLMQGKSLRCWADQQTSNAMLLTHLPLHQVSLATGK